MAISISQFADLNDAALSDKLTKMFIVLPRIFKYSSWLNFYPW